MMRVLLVVSRGTIVKNPIKVSMDNQTYVQSILDTCAARDERVRNNPRHYLALAGLFWLEEGDNPFGSAEGNKIVLPGLPHARCGTLRLRGGKVSLVEPAPGVTLNGQSPEERPLAADADGDPDLIEADTLSLMVIRRGALTLLRAWDGASPAHKNFKGMKYFPVNPDFRLTARYERYDPPKPVTVLDAIGTSRESALLGRVRFNLAGGEFSLEVEEDEDGGLVSFTDETRKDLTYPGGRYLLLVNPLTPELTLDFNLAVNWPCAYTPFATCPLPPRENHLPARVEAGEMRYYD
jgi:uncharacterized protein (DUF1684 family)